MSAGFTFTSPNGTHRPARRTQTTGRSSRRSFSYLGNNWVASANFFYDINTKSAGRLLRANSSITSGNALYGDLTAVYKIGKWSIGPVGYFEVQTTADTGAGCNPCAWCGEYFCGRYRTAAAGGLVGYDFGPVDLQLWVTDSFVGQDSPVASGNLNVWSRIGFKIWGFEQPVAPLVTKN